MAQSKNVRKTGGKLSKQNPFYPLKEVKSRISQGNYRINSDVQRDAIDILGGEKQTLRMLSKSYKTNTFTKQCHQK